MTSRQPRTLGHAQDRLTFLLALVPYLLERERVTVAEAAEHFAVSPREVREAVELIAVSGVPGETGSYQHTDLFDIAWDDFEEHDEIVITHRVAIDDSPRFSAREAAALIAGLQYLQSLPGAVDSTAAATLMAKLTRGASAAPSQVAVGAPETRGALEQLQRAVRDGVQVRFDYVGADGEHKPRTVDPLRLDSDDQHWYLRGWCHARGALRTFRVDRVLDLVVTEDLVDPKSRDLALPDTLFSGNGEIQTVTVRVESARLAFLGEYAADATQSGTDTTLVPVRVAHVHGLKRVITELAGAAEVIEPSHARAAVRHWAEEALAQYSDNTNR